MKNTVFIRRVRAKNYRSIAACDVELGSVSYLVGANGSGKGNFLDVLHFVKDALQGSLENALQVRGGLSEVRRRSGGHPTHFGIRLDFRLPDGRDGYYAFNVGARPASGFEVQREECAIGAPDVGPSFLMSGGGSGKDQRRGVSGQHPGSPGASQRRRIAHLPTRLRRAGERGFLQPESACHPQASDSSCRKHRGGSSSRGFYRGRGWTLTPRRRSGQGETGGSEARRTVELSICNGMRGAPVSSN